MSKEQVLCRHCGQPIGGGPTGQRSWFHLGRAEISGSAWCNSSTSLTLAQPPEEEAER